MARIEVYGADTPESARGGWDMLLSHGLIESGEDGRPATEYIYRLPREIRDYGRDSDSFHGVGGEILALGVSEAATRVLFQRFGLDTAILESATRDDVIDALRSVSRSTVATIGDDDSDDEPWDDLKGRGFGDGGKSSRPQPGGGSSWGWIG